MARDDAGVCRRVDVVWSVVVDVDATRVIGMIHGGYWLGMLRRDAWTGMHGGQCMVTV